MTASFFNLGAVPDSGRQTSDPSPYLTRLLVETRDGTSVLSVEEIDWFEASDGVVLVHAGSATYTVRTTLRGLAARLDPDRFHRIHRSALANLDRVVKIRHGRGAEPAVELRDGRMLPLSRAGKRRLVATLR